MQTNAQIDSLINIQQDTLLVQFKKNTNIQFGKLGNDSLKLIMQVKKETDFFPATFIVSVKLLGDGSGFLIEIPAALKKDTTASWTFLEYIATASNDNIFIKPKEYASFGYAPFDFHFVTVPPRADIYIVPLEEWIKHFNREDIDFSFSRSMLPRIQKYKILKSTPCSYAVFEQPYIGVFVQNDRIKLEYIKPRRNTPADNRAEITF